MKRKNRIDLDFDPPPDLALEIDLTSRSYPSLYQAIGVPELWQFSQAVMEIRVLREQAYVCVEESPNFPGLPVKTAIAHPLQLSKTLGRNPALRAFRAWVRQYSSPAG